MNMLARKMHSTKTSAITSTLLVIFLIPGDVHIVKQIDTLLQLPLLPL